MAQKKKTEKKKKTMRQIGQDSVNAIKRRKKTRQQLMKELFGKRKKAGKRSYKV